MSDIDKYFADKLNIDRAWLMDNDVIEFSIEYPVCREAIRNEFKLCTLYTLNSEWECHNSRSSPVIYGNGKTVAEAEIAVCNAIYEARDD